MSSKKPATVLHKIVAAIRAHQAGAIKGSSRAAISKYLKSEFHYENSNALKMAFAKGVADGILVQEGQSFRVAADPVPVVVEGPSLEIQDTKKGSGPATEKGDTIIVAYRGTLEDGHQFDKASSFSFVLGGGDVIKGWDKGLIGMRKGGERTLVVPPELGYGKRGCKPDIPPSATLHFSVTLKKIVRTT
jgi:FKBP-type peptidyl-prolyl cis-trans isomerase